MSGSNTIFTSQHDVDLCRHAANGERRAFGELVRRHGSGIRQLLRRMGAQPSEADDVAQDAFLAAFERITEFRGEGTFAGWRIAFGSRSLRTLELSTGRCSWAPVGTLNEPRSRIGMLRVD